MATTTAPAPLRERLFHWLKDELNPQQLIASLSAAVILYLLEIVLTLSIAALIFSGNLASQFSHAISFILIGNALLIATIAMSSSYGGSIAANQDAPGVILALAVASIATTLPTSVATDQLFPTIAVLIVGSTLTMGLVCLLLGSFKLGGLVRFLPYPVMGGFLAGTGWLLTVGGISVATNVPFSAGLLQPDMLARWLPTLLLGLVMLLISNHWNSPLVLVGVFAIALIAFYSVVRMLNIPSTALASDGWLLGPFPRDIVWHFPLDAHTLSQVNGQALLSAIPIAAPAMLISVIALLLNTSSLELLVKQDIGLSHELIAAGAANLLSGLSGGLIGYHAISLSTLNHALSKGKRLPGLLAALLLILTIFLGATLLSFIPRMLLGSLLVYIGLALLYAWVFRAWFTFPKIDSAIILSIVVVIALKDFLWGIGLGVIMTILLFVISYSRISSVRYELSGTTFRSRVGRGMRQWELLQAQGEQLLIFKLQGFIFFGTANNLFERLRTRVRGPTGQSVRFILLDFEQVSGLDSTGLLSFSKLLQFAHESKIELIMTGLTNSIRDQLLHGGFTEQTHGVHLFADMDRGIEWCEDQIIAGVYSEWVPTIDLQEQFLTIVPDKTRIATLLENMQRREVAAGEYLIRQSDEPDQLYILVSGQLTAQLEKPGRVPVRLETMQSGRMVGELGFFLGTRRNASVVADYPSVVYILTRAEWDQIKQHNPEVAQTLNSLAIHLLAQRVSHLTRVVNALQY